MEKHTCRFDKKRIQIQKKQFPDGRTLIRCRNYRGDARMEMHPVFPGIGLVFIEGHTDRCPFGITEDPDRIELHFCREGRVQRRHGEQFLYLTPGDTALIRSCPGTDEFSFPLCHYHGITIVFDRKMLPDSFGSILSGVEVSLEELMRKCCGSDGYGILRGQRSLQKIFLDLYTPPVRGKRGYFQVKLLELLLALDVLEPTEQKKAAPALSKIQMELAKETAAYLTANLDKRIPAEQLAQRFHVSETCLRNAFKGVYGVPVSAYARIQKMHQAALQLIHSDRTIQEIANNCGYDNASKFSAAFREIMGESPLDYRKSHT